MSTDDSVERAASRILARTHAPRWHPTDAELDAWGRGYFAGHRQGYADAFSSPRPKPTENDWPPVAKPGGGA
jgi:hypothetical protein